MKRNTESKKRIKQAFVELLNEKNFESLTISDIARQAEINRGTFYLHYLDKYDLMDKLEFECISELKHILLSHSNNIVEQPNELISYEDILKALYFVKEDFDFISAVSQKGSDPRFINMIKKVLRELLFVKLADNPQFSTQSGPIPEAYIVEILLSNIVAIIILWISNGGQESPEQIAEMIEIMKKTAPIQLIQKNG